MTVFVLAHGAYWEGEDHAGLGGKYTIVPDGMRIFFYARPDEGLLPMNALEVLRLNGAGGYIEAADAGTQIPNYSLSPLDDFEWRAMLSGGQPGQDVRAVGREFPGSVDRLCTTSGSCSPAGHTCTGLFAYVNDPEVHLLTCRVGPTPVGSAAVDAVEFIGDDDDDQNLRWRNTQHLPGEAADNPAHLNEVKNVALRILDLVNIVESEAGYYFSNVENADAGALFDQLDEAMQVKLMAIQQIQVWSYQRYARMTVRAFAQRSDYASALNAWKNGLADREKLWFSWDPELKAALGL